MLRAIHYNGIVIFYSPLSVPIHKWLIYPISALGKNFNPQNTPCIPLVKILSCLEIEQIISFLDKHQLER